MSNPEIGTVSLDYQDYPPSVSSWKTAAHVDSVGRAQREALLTTPMPERHWQQVGTDLFFWENNSYLLVEDYFSCYTEVARLHAATANIAIAATQFQRLLCLIKGHSTVVLLKVLVHTHITSSLRYQQAKTELECAVATVKGLWKGGEGKTTSFSPPNIIGFTSKSKTAHQFNLQSGQFQAECHSLLHDWICRKEKRKQLMQKTFRGRGCGLHEN